MKSIAARHPEVVQSVTLPILFHTLPDEAPTEDDADGRDKYRSVLDALTELCTLPSLFEALVVRITTKLDMLSSAASSAESAQRECTVAYSWDLLHTLQRVIDAKLLDKHVDLSKYFGQVVPRIYGLAIPAALPRTSQVQPLFRDRRLLTVISNIAEALFWELSPE